MGKIQSEMTSDFTMVHNAFIKDKRINASEKGVLLVMLQKPAGYRFTIRGLANEMKDGVTSITTSIHKAGILGKRYLDKDLLSENGLVYDSTTLLADSNLTVREYFRLADGVSAPPENTTIDGEPVRFGKKTEKKKDYYYIDITNVSMQDFSKAYDMQINGKSVAAYTVNDYLLRAYDEKKTPELADLVTSLYYFSTSIDAYRQSESGFRTYYNVKFRAGSEESTDRLKLPEDGLFTSDRTINSLPTPYKPNSTFLGWYYDAELTRPANNKDFVDCNMTLYADMSDHDASLLEGAVKYSTVVDASEDFTFQVKADSEERIREALSYINAATGESVNYSIISNGNGIYTIVSENGLKYNQAYLVLLESGAPDVLFVQDDIEQSMVVRELNIVTERREVNNVKLNGDMICIPSTDVSELTGRAYDSLFNVNINSDGDSETEYNKTEGGTFVYDKEVLPTNAIVAIYTGDEREGQRQRNSSWQQRQADQATNLI